MTFSLFSLCLEYVAANIHEVESFIGFPDTVGKIIFLESVAKGQFMNIKNSDRAKSNLKVFFDAYAKNGILNSLCLGQCHLFVNDALIDCPWLLQNLTDLDLSFCRLGDDHEFLPQIVTIQSLKILNLQANCLSDDGIRHLTTPLRFHGKKHGLKYIDLSSNDITPRSLHFVKSFHRICAIIVSDSSIGKQIGKCGLGSNFSPHNSCLCCDNLCLVTTDGWAKEVLDNWKQEYHSKLGISIPSSPVISSSSFTDQNPESLDAITFYGKRKPLSITRNHHDNNKIKIQNRLILVTEHFCCPRNYSKTSSHLSHLQSDSESPAVYPSAKNIVSPHRKDEFSSTQHRKCTNVFSAPSSSTLIYSRDQHSKRKLKTETYRDKKIKEIGVNGEENNNANSVGIQNRKKMRASSPDPDSNDVLKFYAETNLLNPVDDRKSEGRKKKKSLIEQLQELT